MLHYEYTQKSKLSKINDIHNNTINKWCSALANFFKYIHRRWKHELKRMVIAFFFLEKMNGHQMRNKYQLETLSHFQTNQSFSQWCFQACIADLLLPIERNVDENSPTT